MAPRALLACPSDRSFGLHVDRHAADLAREGERRLRAIGLRHRRAEVHADVEGFGGRVAERSDVFDRSLAGGLPVDEELADAAAGGLLPLALRVVEDDLDLAGRERLVGG